MPNRSSNRGKGSKDANEIAFSIVQQATGQAPKPEPVVEAAPEPEIVTEEVIEVVAEAEAPVEVVAEEATEVVAESEAEEKKPAEEDE